MSRLNNLEEWDPHSSFKDNKPFTLIVSATRGCGKSHMVRHLFEKYWKKQFDIVIVFCGSDYIDTYAEFIPGQLLYSDYQPEVIDRVYTQLHECRGYGKNGFRTLVIMDDIMSETLKSDESIRKIFRDGRHQNMSIVVIGHTLTDFNPKWRSCINYVIAFRAPDLNSKEHLVNQYLSGIFDDDMAKSKSQVRKEWAIFMKNLFDTPYQALVIDYKTSQTKLYKYCAPLK